jgi:hypothetical protein
MSAIPKMYYKIIQKDSNTVLNELKQRTNDFQSITNQEYKEHIIQQLQSNNNTIFYGFLNDSPSLDTNKKVIGKDGCYLTKTTQTQEILFIWHNRTKHQFEFWAYNRYNLINALNAIYTRLHNNGTYGSPNNHPS